MDHSAALDLIAFGGVQGLVGTVDSTTLSFKGLYEGHPNQEMAGLYFYDPQLQMLTVTTDGDVSIWDA